MINKNYTTNFEWLSVKDFAERYAVSTKSVYRWIKQDRVKHKKIGNVIRILDEKTEGVGQ